MGEEIPDTMNLDLNLGPGPDVGTEQIPSEALNLDDWINDSVERVREAATRVREAATRVRVRQRSRWRQLQIPPGTQYLSVELDQLIGSSVNGVTLQTGEGSVAPEERHSNGASKTCENNNGFSENDASEKKNDVEKGGGSDGSFFDCNICFDLSRDPVVTSCGHLYCWACLYRWLHMHADVKECPVCKGEVTLKTVTPIYGRANSNREAEDDPGINIPMRPQGRRVESLRQTLQRTSLNFPIEEMLRRLQNRFDRELPPVPEPSNREIPERGTLVNRFLTSRGIRGEYTPVSALEDNHLGRNQDQALFNRLITSRALDIAPPSVTTEIENEPPRLLRRQSHRGPRISSLSSTLTPAAERLLEFVNPSYRSINNHLGRSQEQAPAMDDRDSFSSIAAVINSESQVDTAVEIDSMVTHSTSSSRRRNEASRVSDVDSADSRAPRRRRLN